MKFRLLDLNPAGKEDFPRILLYSILVHYIVFYLLFGNPFLIPLNRIRSGSGAGALDVELFTPSQIEKKQEDGGGDDPYPIVFPPEEGNDEADRPETKEARVDPLDEAGMNLVEAAAPIPPSPEKKKERKLPPNMTGPQDCMLKLVGMVCPNGDFSCIEAYKAFCENLPREISAASKGSGPGEKR